jgi:hypothetical protein
MKRVRHITFACVLAHFLDIGSCLVGQALGKIGDDVSDEPASMQGVARVIKKLPKLAHGSQRTKAVIIHAPKRKKIRRDFYLSRTPANSSELFDFLAWPPFSDSALRFSAILCFVT